MAAFKPVLMALSRVLCFFAMLSSYTSACGELGSEEMLGGLGFCRSDLLHLDANGLNSSDNGLVSIVLDSFSTYLCVNRALPRAWEDLMDKLRQEQQNQWPPVRKYPLIPLRDAVP